MIGAGIGFLVTGESPRTERHEDPFRSLDTTPLRGEEPKLMLTIEENERDADGAGYADGRNDEALLAFRGAVLGAARADCLRYE